MAYERRDCGAGVKTRYPDRSAAETALRHLLMDGRLDAPLSTYGCTVCGGWHMTSRPGGEARGARRTVGRPGRRERPVGPTVRIRRD